MALLPACHMWFFETVNTEFQQWETQTGRKRNEKYKKRGKKAGLVPTEKMCFGFLEDRNFVWDDKVLSKFKVSEWLTKYQQIHRPVCLFTSGSSGMCTQTESEQTPKPTNTQSDSQEETVKAGRQIHFDANRPWLLPVCQKASPFSGIMHSFLSFRL